MNFGPGTQQKRSFETYTPTNRKHIRKRLPDGSQKLKPFRRVAPPVAPLANGKFRTFIVLEFPVSLAFKAYLANIENNPAIKENLSKVVATRAESYLRDAAAADDLSADYFHALSEGYGFILSLQFTYTANGTPYFTNAEVNDMLATLEAGNGFWDRTDTELIEMADAINAVTGL